MKKLSRIQLALFGVLFVILCLAVVIPTINRITDSRRSFLLALEKDLHYRSEDNNFDKIVVSEKRIRATKKRIRATNDFSKWVTWEIRDSLLTRFECVVNDDCHIFETDTWELKTENNTFQLYEKTDYSSKKWEHPDVNQIYDPQKRAFLRINMENPGHYEHYVIFLSDTSGVGDLQVLNGI